jgi:thiamine biosynthesis lipoprotein
MKYLLFLFLYALTACSSRTGSQKLHTFTGQTMGTTYTVKVCADTLPVEDFHQQIKNKLLHVNKLMSSWDPQSEISLFNKAPANKPFSMSVENIRLISYALEISRKTKGMYDITAAPLINLWGFGPEGMYNKIPEPEAIAKAKQLTGYTFLTLSPEHNTLTKSLKGISCNLSSIAKGYGVDAIAALIHNMGISNYLVEIGGELKVYGSNNTGKPWSVGIARPNPGKQVVTAVIRPGNTSIATSGDYQNYFIKDGIQYTHIINPVTGKPVLHSLASVTVLDTECMKADALATAILVLGPEKGMAFADEENIACHFILRTDKPDIFTEKSSRAFEKRKL